jgi:hypothetical protein
MTCPGRRKSGQGTCQSRDWSGVDHADGMTIRFSLSASRLPRRTQFLRAKDQEHPDRLGDFAA